MPEQRLLDEYILTDVGKIWVGPYGSSRGREWVFGQFDACVLPAAMLMFQRSELAPMRLLSFYYLFVTNIKLIIFIVEEIP